MYAQTILGQFSLEKANTITLPMDLGVHLTKSQSPTTENEKDDMANVPYRKFISSLMYTAVAMHPDITHTVTALLQFLENPRCMHWQAAQRVLKYLKGMVDFGLMYGLADVIGMPVGKPMGYTDADFTLQEHWHSVSGYAFLMHGGAILWLSKTQAVCYIWTSLYYADTSDCTVSYFLFFLTPKPMYDMILWPLLVRYDLVAVACTI